jgi:hypothetical protein
VYPSTKEVKSHEEKPPNLAKRAGLFFGWLRLKARVEQLSCALSCGFASLGEVNHIRRIRANAPGDWRAAPGEREGLVSIPASSPLAGEAGLSRPPSVWLARPEPPLIVVLLLVVRVGQPRKLGPNLQPVAVARGPVQCFRQRGVESLRPIRFFGFNLGLAVLAGKLALQAR